MEFERKWAMPNRATFSIKPIVELLDQERGDGLWIDPFARNSVWANITNDLNPDTNALYHMDAIEFLKGVGAALGFEGSDPFADGVLYDPPYSVRQVAECYKNVGMKVTQETTRSDFYTHIKREIARIVKPGGKVISFGWNSNGIGKRLGFSIDRILLVAHGGVHNDTIVTVEHKDGEKANV